MKLIILLNLLIASAYAAPNREMLFECLNYDETSPVVGAFIYQKMLGPNKLYEIEVDMSEDSRQRNFFRRVNLIEIYGGRILHFTTGNFRIKFDRVQVDNQGLFPAFARIPQYGIHSKNWKCKAAL